MLIEKNQTGIMSCPGKVEKKVKLIIYGEEIINKTINTSGKGGRIYLPYDWVGRRIKVIRID